MYSIEEIKKKKMRVRFLVPDTLPLHGLKRMQYYISFNDAPTVYYLGLSFGDPVDRKMLREMVKSGALVELKEALSLPYEKDIWLSDSNQIWVASAVAPFEDKEKQIITGIEEFGRIYQMVKEQIEASPIRPISRFVHVSKIAPL